jgi:hypothetical protein
MNAELEQYKREKMAQRDLRFAILARIGEGIC